MKKIFLSILADVFFFTGIGVGSLFGWVAMLSFIGKEGVTGIIFLLLSICFFGGGYWLHDSFEEKSNKTDLFK